MIFVTPQSKKELILNEEMLTTADGEESYSLIKGVPVLLPEKMNPDWSRELLEIIFWEHPDIIVKIYDEIETDNVTDWNEVYIKYIKKIHVTKENVLKAFDSYRQKETDTWITGDKSGNITEKQIEQFEKFADKSIGEKRTVTKLNGEGLIWDRYRYFGELVCKEQTDKILELATGAGGGTASVALYMPKDCKLYTVDIGFDCLGNAIVSVNIKRKALFLCALISGFCLSKINHSIRFALLADWMNQEK